MPLKDQLLKLLPEEITCKHIDHWVEEDGDVGWCYTCNESINDEDKSPLITLGKNKMLKEVKDILSKVELDGLAITNYLLNYQEDVGKRMISVEELSEALCEADILKCKN